MSIDSRKDVTAFFLDKTMEPYKENGTVTLRRERIKPPATRLVGHSPSLRQSGAVCVSSFETRKITAKAVQLPASHSIQRADLTEKDFSVTRARAHARAQVRTSARAYAHAQKDEGGLSRVLGAVLQGGDVRVAAIKPMSFQARFIAALLLPVMLVMPLAPAYANDAPLAERVASDVAAFVESTPAVASATAPTEEAAPAPEVTQAPETANAAGAAPEIASATPVADAAPTVVDTPAAESPVSTGGEVAGATDNAEGTPAPTTPPAETPETPVQDEASGGGSVQTSETLASSTATTTEVASTEIPATDTQVNIPLSDEHTSLEQVEETPVLDVPSQEVQEDLQTIRARLRDEVRSEVKMEVRREIEREVYRGCKNLDGVGYYCLPDANAFGAPIIENERAISVVVQQDTSEGDKEIFLVRDASTIQLTHNADDDVFPVLDQAGDTLVWQSLVSGHWQIAYAHVKDVGVPKVHYLTRGENNFNPKVYRGRIAWQAWVDGNWEIFSAIPAREKIADDALTAEHRLAGVDGNWEVKRITANDAPDMFPSVSGDTVTWQAVDGGVWQVFAYDIGSGEVRRVSKPGVKSESPRAALVWNEEDSSGQMRLVGSDPSGSESIDFTALARRIVDNSKEQPNAPISNTEVVVTAPVVVRAEDDAALPQAN